MSESVTMQNSARARAVTRRLLVQAIYQRLLGGQGWQELYGQYGPMDPTFARAVIRHPARVCQGHGVSHR